jgi:hypothetical protein
MQQKKESEDLGPVLCLEGNIRMALGGSRFGEKFEVNL